MKTRKTKWLTRACILAGVLAAGWWIYSRLHSEPSYDGRRVSYWFREYCYSGQFIIRGNFDWGRHQECADAFAGMGTNAVPYLVDQAFDFRQPTATWSNIYRFLDELPPSLHLPRPIPAQARAEESTSALKAIKPPAAQLLKSMQKHLKATNAYEHRQVLFILGTSGEGAEEALPYLIAALKEKDSWTRQMAIQSLSWIGPRAAAAAPALIEVMQEPKGTNYLGLNAATALGCIGGPDALAAVPMIRELFEKETNWNLKGCIGAALMKANPRQTQVLDFLIQGLTNHQPANERWMAASYLGQIGPAAKSAAPVLIQTLSATNMFAAYYNAQALKEIGIAPEIIVSHINGDLKSTNETERFNCANEMMRIDPPNKEAHEVMADLISRPSALEPEAIDNLGNAGPLAADTLPLLRRVARESTNPDIRKTAMRAIRRIEGTPK